MAKMRSTLIASGLSGVAVLFITACLHGEDAGSLEACFELDGLRIASDQIGLPTQGAKVVASQHMQSDRSTGDVGGQFCRVSGEIVSVDMDAPPIQFVVDLPDTWNSKAIAYGGGGFDGFIPPTGGPYTMAPSDGLVPVEQGYMVFGSDSGHGPNFETRNPSTDGGFALNDEALENYFGDALKKTRDVAVFIAEQRYGALPELTYFLGGSNGGKEGLLAIQKWPEDYDGAVIIYPWRAAGTGELTFGRVTRALGEPGAYLGPDKQALLADAVMLACDGLDGLSDGVISNVEACQFDPKSLQCSSASDVSGCLTDAQLRMLEVYALPYTYSFIDGPDGTHPGFPVLQGADLRGEQQLNQRPPVFPPQKDMPTVSEMWGQFVRYFIAQDAEFDVNYYDPESPGAYLSRTKYVATMMNVPVTDFAEFRANGGKLILLHGLADALVSHRTTNRMWEQLTEKVGAEEQASFARYYTIPGYGHGPLGANVFEPSWDSLSALDLWVESGISPQYPVVSDTKGFEVKRERPLCEYPAWPQFRGGDPNSSGSFECTISD